MEKENTTIQRATLLKVFSENNFSQNFLMEISKMIKYHRDSFGEDDAENFAKSVVEMMKLYSDENEILSKLKEDK